MRLPFLFTLLIPREYSSDGKQRLGRLSSGWGRLRSGRRID
jgi:hypothetical protein